MLNSPHNPRLGKDFKALYFRRTLCSSIIDIVAKTLRHQEFKRCWMGSLVCSWITRSRAAKNWILQKKIWEEVQMKQDDLSEMRTFLVLFGFYHIIIWVMLFHSLYYQLWVKDTPFLQGYANWSNALFPARSKKGKIIIKYLRLRLWRTRRSTGEVGFVQGLVSQSKTIKV